MGREHLNFKKTGLVAETRGPKGFILQVRQMACVTKRQWKEEINRRSGERNINIRFLNFSPEEQWDALIHEFSLEFYQLNAEYQGSHDADPGDITRISMESGPELRFRIADNPDSDTFSDSEPVLLTDSVRVIQSGKPASMQENTLPGNRNNIDVFIESGWAFGTGTHPSTVCSVMAMERLRNRGMFHSHAHVLDMGTGTGILAIIAALMGAGEVTAVDIDPEALHFARHNVKINGVDDIVRTISSQEFTESLSTQDFDICLANLTLSVASMLLPEMAADLKHNGLLMLSGFKHGATGTALDLLSRHGLCKIEDFTSSSWRSILAGHDLKKH